MQGSPLVRAALSAGLATLYTTPTDRYARAEDVVICNTDSVSRNVTLKFGGFFIFDALPLAASETLHIEKFGQALKSGELIEGFASAADVVHIHISGSEG